MKTKLTMLSKLTVAGLIGAAAAIWIQWLSGDPAYTRFPPGPVIFIAIAGIIVLGARWWWTPLIGALIGLLVTSGWFVRLPAAILRLTHPGSVASSPRDMVWLDPSNRRACGHDVAGLAATVQNYRRSGNTTDSAKMACRFFGGIFVLMGIMVIVGGVHADKYHNLMHLIWGALALGASFLGLTVSKRFCIGSGVFYLSLAILGLLLGNPSMNRVWYSGHAVKHRRPYLSPGARFSLPRGGTSLWPGVETSAEVQLSGN